MLMCRNYNNSFRTSRSRPCARCVWTGWRTWSLCAATAPASCAGTEWASAPSAARPSSAASSSTRAPETLLLRKPKQTTSNLPQLHQLLLLDHPHSTRVRQPRASSNVLLFTANALLTAVMESCYKKNKNKGKSRNWLRSGFFLLLSVIATSMNDARFTDRFSVVSLTLHLFCTIPPSSSHPHIWFHLCGF